MYKRHVTGKEGEQVATEFLKYLGYEIIERNFQTRQGEIDIIAKDKEEYVFIEVKTRKNKNYGEPIDAIDKRKIEHMKGAIRYYLYIHQLENELIRIDVIEVLYQASTFQIHHIKQAIE